MSAGGGAGLIDLGEDRSEPVTHRYRRPVRRVPPVLAAAVAVLALLASGGYERVVPRLVPLAEVPATRSAVVALTADTAFLGDWSEAVVDGRQLLGIVSAYPLPGDAPRWRARLPVPAQSLRVAPGAGVVLATTVVDGAQAVTALDAGTGRVLWQVDSREPVHVPADSAAALFYGPGAYVRWVDLRSGRDLWSRSLPPYGDFGLVPGAAPTGRARVLTASPDGWVEVVDETTGALVASGPIGGAAGAAGHNGEAGDSGTAGDNGETGDSSTGSGGAAGGDTVVGVPGRILVMRPRPAGSRSVTAYDPDTLHPLWTISGTFQGVAWACGDLLCMPDAEGLRALDPASGATAWHNSDWETAVTVDRERLIAFADDPGRGLAVLGAATGRELTRLTGWTSVDDPDSRQPVLLARPDAAGGSIFARLDPGRVRPAVLGDLRDAAPATCQAATGVLVCATVRHTLKLWRHGH